MVDFNRKYSQLAMYIQVPNERKSENYPTESFVQS